MKWKMENGKLKVNPQFEGGLTLVEVLVAVGIAVVAGTLLLVIIVNSASLFTSQSSKVTEGLNINDALVKIRSSVKQASSVVSQYNDGSATYTSGAGQLVLGVASIDASGNIISASLDYFVFFLDQSYLHFKTFPDAVSSRQAADRILTNLASGLSFEYLNSANPPAPVPPVSAAKIRITLTLNQKGGLGFETNTATTEANLRND